MTGADKVQPAHVDSDSSKGHGVLVESVASADLVALVERGRRDGLLHLDDALSALGVEMTADVVAELREYFAERGIAIDDSVDTDVDPLETFRLTRIAEETLRGAGIAFCAVDIEGLVERQGARSRSRRSLVAGRPIRCVCIFAKSVRCHC